MRYKDIFVTFNTQTTRLVPLPDLPGVVVLVHQVTFQMSSFSDVTAATVVLDHNIEEGLTLSVTSESTSRWFASDQGASGGGPAPTVHRYDPPYELVGKQRLDALSSVGTVSGRLVIHYTTRRESNRTRWNALRMLTSFERG